MVKVLHQHRLYFYHYPEVSRKPKNVPKLRFFYTVENKSLNLIWWLILRCKCLVKKIPKIPEI